MKTITQILTEKTSAAFAVCGYSGELGLVTASDRPDLCQFQCNGAFAGAKMYRKPPAVIAGEVAAQLSGDDIFKSVSVVAAGFINFILSDSFILSYVKSVSEDENLGIEQSKERETIFLDYGGPNVAKPLHIGHLRSAIIGEALKRLANATGRKTVSDVHLGDWGLQMGLVIAQLQEQNSGDLTRISLSADELNEIYPLASKRSKQDEAFKALAQDITARLQRGDPEYVRVWKKIMEISVADIKANYELLNVSFDLWYGESNAEKYVDSLISLLNQKGLLIDSLGAKVVEVAEPTDKITVPPVIIKKSNNSNIYATTDLATLIEREKDFHPNEIWYVVDSRQSLHFTQVFRCAKKAGIVPQDTALLHLGFGTMNGSDAKPYKTRDGGVMKLSDFYNLVYEKVYEKVSSSAFSRDADKRDIAKKITVATIKFGDLINHRMKDYIFDIDKFTASEGKTGSFLLYTIARINSILKKTSPEACAADFPELIYTDVERSLWLKLALSNEVFSCAYNEKAPNLLCENAYQIASDFSKFYHENHIMNESDIAKKSAWIKLCTATKELLLKHLDTLGMEPVELM